MSDIISYIASLPDAVIYASTAVIVSIILQKVKKWLDLQSPRVIVALLTVLSFIPVAIDYIVSATAENPVLLGQDTAVIVGLATLAYRVIVQPFTNLLNDAKSERERKSLEAVQPVVPTVVTPEVATPVLSAPDPTQAEAVTPITQPVVSEQ